MKQKSLCDIIKEYENWMVPWLIIVLLLILIVICFLILDYDITVILAIVTSLIVAITTLLVMLITSAENRKNIIFQIKYEHDLKQLIKFKKHIKDIDDTYANLTIHKDEIFEDYRKYYLDSADYLIWMFVWLYTNEELISQLPNIIKTKLDEVDEYYSQKDNEEMKLEQMNEIIMKINSTKWYDLNKYPLMHGPSNAQTQNQIYCDHIKIIKKLLIEDNLFHFNHYKSSTADDTKIFVFFNELNDYLRGNSFEQIIYDDIEGTVDIDISQFD